jgi:hypothetical protein
VFTARYALSPYIKHIRFVFKGLKDTDLRTLTHKALNINNMRPAIPLEIPLKFTAKTLRLISNGPVGRYCKKICCGNHMKYTYIFWGKIVKFQNSKAMVGIGYHCALKCWNIRWEVADVVPPTEQPSWGCNDGSSGGQTIDAIKGEKQTTSEILDYQVLWCSVGRSVDQPGSQQLLFLKTIRS